MLARLRAHTGCYLVRPRGAAVSFQRPHRFRIIKWFILDGRARHYGGLLTVIPKPLFTNICFVPARYLLPSSPLILYFLRSGLHYSLHFGRSSHSLTVLLARDPFPNVVIVVIWLCFSLLSLLYCCILAFLCVLSPFPFDWFMLFLYLLSLIAVTDLLILFWSAGTALFLYLLCAVAVVLRCTLPMSCFDHSVFSYLQIMCTKHVWI